MSAAIQEAPGRIIQAAHRYAKKGWRVLPVHTVKDGECSCGKPNCSAPGKHPRTPSGLLDATTAVDVINGWWMQWPDANVAIATGPDSGIVAIDVDDHAAFDRLTTDLGELPQTIEARTGRGTHLLFEYPAEGIASRNGVVAAGVDIKGKGGYIVAAPSLHVSGERYAWIDTGVTDPEELPAQWLQRLQSPPSPRPNGDDGRPPFHEGGRNNLLTSLGGAMRERGMGQDAIAAALHATNETSCTPPLGKAEVDKVAWSVCRYEARAPPGRVGADDLDPEPLPGLPTVPEFNPDLLPEAFRPWVTDVAERIQCPPDFPAVGAMVAIASIVGRQIGIRPKRLDNWFCVPNLWGAVIGRPGVMKTPALMEPVRPLNLLECLAKEAHEHAIREYEADQFVADQQRIVAKEQIKKALKAGQDAKELALCATDGDAEPPARRRYSTSDATVEKLGELLRDNPRGILVCRDELTGLLRTLDRDGHEGARAFFLESWNGTGRFTFDRIGRGTVDVEAACISILGGIQPGPLTRYLGHALRGGESDDGLLQRFQLMVWPDVGSDWKDIDRWPDTGARQQAWDVFDRLDVIEAMGERDSEGDVPFLRFDPEAQEIFSEWRSTLELRLRSDDHHPAFEAHLSKYRSLIPSLALLIHLVDTEDGSPVSADATLRACAWGAYLKDHARRIYAPALAGDAIAAEKLLAKIKRGDLGGSFTARDVYRKCWGGLDRETVEPAARMLVEYGWLKFGPINNGVRGRPSTVYEIYPKAMRTE